MPDNIALVIDIGGVLADHHLLVGVNGVVGIEVTLTGVETVAALGGSDIVINLIPIVQLLVIEHLLARHGIGDIETLEGALLVLIWLAGQPLVPVEVGLHGVAVLVLGNHVGLVAAVGRVGKACAQDGVAHPHHKLLILRVGDFVLVHPEAVNGDVTARRLLAPQAVLAVDAHLQEAPVDKHHAVWRRLTESTAANTDHLTATARGRCRLCTETAGQRQRKHSCQQK